MWEVAFQQSDNKVENLLFYCTVLFLQIARRLKYPRRHPHRLPQGAEGCSAAWGWRRAAPRPGGAAAVVLGSRSGPIRSEGCSARGRQVKDEPENLAHFYPADKLRSTGKNYSKLNVIG